MKRLAVYFFLALPLTTIAQSNKMYAKISTGVYLPQRDRPATFNAHFSFGPKIGNYLGAGLNCGFYRINSDKTPVIPIGLDLTILDFDHNDVSLSATIGCGYPIYSSEETLMLSGLTVTTELQGAWQAKAAVGVAFPLEKRKKLMIMGGYSPVAFKTKITETSFSGNQSQINIINSTPRTDLFFLAIEIIL